ncbi:MAG: hypothetical protein ACXABY_14465 [Candidatus Thorarchaeota archaeon]|jgi:hypothetical protein
MGNRLGGNPTDEIRRRLALSQNQSAVQSSLRNNPPPPLIPGRAPEDQPGASTRVESQPVVSQVPKTHPAIVKPEATPEQADIAGNTAKGAAVGAAGGPVGAAIGAGTALLTSVLQSRAAKAQQERAAALAGLQTQARAGEQLAQGTQAGVSQIIAGIKASQR